MQEDPSETAEAEQEVENDPGAHAVKNVLLRGASRVPVLFTFAGITRYNSILNCCDSPNVMRYCFLRFLRFFV
jgi:hypothetical protein